MASEDVKMRRHLICYPLCRLYSDDTEASIFQRFSQRAVTLDLGRFVMLRTINENADPGNTV
jgi:hypothetical protein